MNVNAETLKIAVLKKGYKWFEDRPNLIGIRTSLQVPDVFNDLFIAVWKQPSFSPTLSVMDKQAFLNSYLFIGKNNLPLAVDGDAGGNTQFALDAYNASVGKFRMKAWTITTDPGTYWLNHPENPKGTAVLKPGQYASWSLGFHQNKKEHPALVQTSSVTVYRDKDFDNVAEETGVEDTGLFGINIHRSNANGSTPAIGKWSAGCQVFQRKPDHDELRRLLENYKTLVGNKFTYTLLREKELA